MTRTTRKELFSLIVTTLYRSAAVDDGTHNPIKTAAKLKTRKYFMLKKALDSADMQIIYSTLQKWE